MKIAVIGGGSGGYVAAIRAAQLGAEVCLIEKDKLGGTCLNVGCIPTKAIIDSAHAFHNAGNSLDIGVEATPILRWEKVQERRENTVKTLVSGVESLMRSNKITVINGEASFISKNALIVADKSGKNTNIEMDCCIIATGSKTFVPPIKGINLPFYIDSTEALKLEKVPKTLVVVGGGVIGVELACAYHEFGTKVTVVEMLNHILPTFDEQLSDELKRQMQKKGIEVLTNSKLIRCEEEGKGGSCIIQTEDGERTLYGEKILICLGRKAVTEGLGLEKIGINVDRGIVVDDSMRTSVSNIFAVGDCNGRLMLAHAASEQGAIAAENAMGMNKVFEASNCPSGVYSFPELAGVGLTEQQAREKGLNYEIGMFPTNANGRALIAKDTEGYVKIIVDKKYGEILGAHILSAYATELIAECAIAIKAECTVEEIINTIHSHPTVSECIHEAALSSKDRAIHIPNKKRG